MKPVTLNGESLTLKQVLRVAHELAEVRIDDDAMARVTSCRYFIEDQVARGAVIYGVTTGFGKNASVVIREQDKAAELQYNLIVSHAIGTGQAFGYEVVRAMMVIRLNTLLAGHSGIRPETVSLLAALLNRGIHPVIPQQGSLGASGDLCPLAHMALALIGMGEVEVMSLPMKTQRRMAAAQALEEAGLEPVRLSYKEGLALINGTSLMAALGTLATARARQQLRLALRSAALFFEALAVRGSALDSRIHKARKHKAQQRVASRMRKSLEGSSLYNISPAAILQHCPGWKEEYEKQLQNDYRVVTARMIKNAAKNPAALRMAQFAERKCNPQDAYTVRCTPQVLGATLQVIRHVEEVMSGELNAAVDNPLIFPDGEGGGSVLSGGNFHGQPLALSLDYLKLGMAELGNFMERQLYKLQDPATNDGLQPFLCTDPGLHSGLMISQYVAAGLVSENKVLVHPASADSIPTSANQEDHVSMGPIAGRQALEIMQNVEKILAIHLMNAAQALDLRLQQFEAAGIPVTIAPATQELHRKVRELVPFLDADRYLHPDLQNLLNHMNEFYRLA